MKERMFDVTTGPRTERVSVEDLPELARVLTRRHWPTPGTVAQDAWNTGKGESGEGTVKEVKG